MQFQNTQNSVPDWGSTLQQLKEDIEQLQRRIKALEHATARNWLHQVIREAREDDRS